MTDQTKEAWTPGSWTTHKDFDTPAGWSVGAGGYIRADLTGPSADRKANAHLIAAAPSLYEALKMVADADSDCCADGLSTIPPAARAKIDAALAKARGES